MRWSRSMRLVASTALFASLVDASPNGTASSTARPDMPHYPLFNAAEPGTTFPAIGFGSGAYGSDPECEARPGCMSIASGCGDCAYASMLTWLRSGGRRLDLAHGYNNDAAVARAIADSGVPRSELFILSKISLGHADALLQISNILRDLETDYVDALLIHWPTRGGTGLDPLCNPPVDERACRISTWRAMLEIFHRGSARSIGVSNYYPEHFAEIIEEGLPLPALNQCPFHLYRSYSQDEVRSFCEDHQIHFNGYSPLAVPDFFTFPPGPAPGMAVTALDDPRPILIGARLGITPAQVMLAWQIRIGVSINPRSVSAQHMQDALDALAAVDLLREEDLLLLGTAPQIWCSVVPSNYQCAPDALQGVVTAAPPAPAAVGPRLGLTNGAGALSAP